VNIRTALPALAGAALLSGTLAVHANAATAHIAPAAVDRGMLYATATIGIAPEDSCLISWRAVVLPAYRGASMLPVWRGTTKVENPCADGHGVRWEDGSVTATIDGMVMPVWRLRPRSRYVLGITVCSSVRGTIGCHTTVRAFWTAA
jgi:hypothetical protein